MIVGLEGIHTFNGFTLNDLSSFPRARLQSIPGLRSLPDFEPDEDDAIGRIGSVPRWAEYGGKSITYEGVLQAQSLIDLRTIQEEFTAAFAVVDEMEMVAEPHGDYAGADELPTRTFWARPLSADPGEEYPQSIRTPWRGYESPFSVVLRLSDPRYYHPDLEVVEDDVAGVVAGAGVPFTPGGYVAAPSANGYQVTATNDGTAPTEAVIKIYGPVQNPIISNETLGVYLKFKDLNIGSGGRVDVDFRRRTATRNNGDQVRHKIVPGSTWWDRGQFCLAPGANTVRLRGYRISAGAKLRVEFNAADWT